MSKLHLLLILFILILSTLLAWIFFNQRNNQLLQYQISEDQIAEDLSAEEYNNFKQKYAQILTEQDPRMALDQLRLDFQTSSKLLRSCHPIAHEIGHQAFIKYQDFGKSLQFQNEVCNSGFIHGVIESYFTSSNNIFDSMNNACGSYTTISFIGWECYHGIGHGLMFYTSNDLPKSLELCSTLTSTFASSTCTNGVFMENFNTDQKIHPSRFLKAADPFYPCQEQDTKFKQDCYTYAPTYFLSLHKNKYQEALKWCLGAENGYQHTCTTGVGSQAIKEKLITPN